MKIIQIEDFFHPDAGYQINVLSKYLAKFGHEVIILTAEIEKVPDVSKEFFGTARIEQMDSDYEKNYQVKIIRLPVWKFISGRAIFTNNLYHVISNNEPDVIFVHNCDTFAGISILHNLKKLKCGVIMDSHMLKMASKNKFSNLFHWWYRKFITPIIVKNKIVVIRTQDDNFVEKELGIPLSSAPWISFGSDTTLFYPDAEQKKVFRKKNGIKEDDFVVVYAGKLDEAKGGMLLAEAIRSKLNANKNIVFMIVGNTSGEYGTKVEELFQSSENDIFRFPTQKYNALAPFFQAADLAVFPKQCSLTFYDVQACGLPVVSEDNNINNDRCSHENGINFKSGDRDSFRKAMVQYANMDKASYYKISDNAYKFVYENYNYEEKAREYERLFFAAIDNEQY